MSSSFGSSPDAIGLIGQPTLRRRARQGALAAIDQRISMRVHLDGMHLTQTADYLCHHVALAGRKDTPFSEDALIVIHQAARGLPRRQQPRPPVPGRTELPFAANKAIVDLSAAKMAAVEVVDD